MQPDLSEPEDGGMDVTHEDAVLPAALVCPALSAPTSADLSEPVISPPQSPIRASSSASSEPVASIPPAGDSTSRTTTKTVIPPPPPVVINMDVLKQWTPNHKPKAQLLNELHDPHIQVQLMW